MYNCAIRKSTDLVAKIIKSGGNKVRRKDKQITDIETLNWIMNEAMVCRIAVCEDNKPYIIPMNFGYKDNCLYLHTGLIGKKIEILKKNNEICFEVDVKNELVKAESPCNWTMKYYSVIGSGKATFVEDLNEKIAIMNIIMEKYSGRSDFQFPESALSSLAIIKITLEEITGKKSKY